MSTSHLLCALLAAFGYSLLNVGMALQKRGADEVPSVEEAGAAASVVAFLTNRTWVVGFLLTNVQVLPVWAALGMGPLSLVTPMLGVGLVVLVLFSVFWLREPAGRRIYLGVGLTILGIVVFTAIGTLPADPPDLARMVALAASGRGFALVGLLLLLTLGPTIAAPLVRFRHADVLFGVASGAATAFAMLSAKYMVAALDSTKPAWNAAHPAVLGGFAVMLAASALSTVVQQVGFQKGRAIILTPIFTVGCVLLPALAGILVFDEWRGLAPEHSVLRIGGLLLLLIGAGLLATARTEPAAGAAGRELHVPARDAVL